MDRPTKKELKAAMTPYRKAMERWAVDCLMLGRKASRPTPMEWRGLVLRVDVVRRGKVVCGVPAPYCVARFYWTAASAGSDVAFGDTGAALVDNLFRLTTRGGLTLEDNQKIAAANSC